MGKACPGVSATAWAGRTGLDHGVHYSTMLANPEFPTLILKMATGLAAAASAEQAS